ncbi:hypothetical protein [Salinarimonas sp.]|uniref:hypothetical protein n=1 Tax=Salinarimonas sp. TaxID=2766526 RepID=UPI0032D8E559
MTLMAADDDFQRLISILREEGYGAIAGEVLQEIESGREIKIQLEDGTTLVRREKIADGEKLHEALHMLRVLLVEPVLKFAAAERVASNLCDATTEIAFVDVEGKASRFDKKQVELAYKLKFILNELARGT